ncbi:LPD7 domain-containing protein [Acidithiobacillus ferrooxidans]|uniref:LPD7 domain-containing protein n=1 Tax=Acidithiobacillus ferrooxidans TaxID=920 RepID=UPI000AF513C1
MSESKITRESLLAEFKAKREEAIARSQVDVGQIAERHRAERADALKAFADGRRDGIIADLKKNGIPDAAFPSILAIEQAKYMEPVVTRQVQEQNESLSVEGVPTWDGFLTEKSRAGEARDAALADELLAELDARKAKGEDIAGENGIEGDPLDPGKLKASMFDGIKYEYDKDADSVHYRREVDGTELFEDKGSRIEMKETSARTIETALLLAQERFKKGTPLTITGDDEFRKEAARIAGKLGIPIKNKDLLEVWQQSRDKAAMGISDEEPDIAPRNGFSGDEAQQDLRKNGPAPERAAPDVAGEGVAPGTGKAGKARSAPSHEPAASKETPSQGATLFKLLDHGGAPYQFKKGESMNYFVKTRDNAGKEHITWGVDLRRAMEESGATKGDLVTITNQGKEETVVQVVDEAGREQWKRANRNRFDVKVADMPLKAAPHLSDAAGKAGYAHDVGTGRVTVPAEDYLAAKADLSVLPASGHYALHQSSQVPFADLQPTEKHALVSTGLADENGLNRRGVAAVLTSDRLLEIRRAQTPENLQGAAVQPGHEKAAARQTEEKAPEQAKAQEVAQEQDQKRILVRNEDQQAQEKKAERKAEVKEHKIEEQKVERQVERSGGRGFGRRSQIDKGRELSR